jgi:hypothetical protein
MITLWLGGTGMVGPETAGLFLLGLPAPALGTWAGLKSFGRLNEAIFRHSVLGLLPLFGVPEQAPAAIARLALERLHGR